MAALIGALVAVACGGGNDELTEAAGVSCDPARSAPEGVTEYEFAFGELQVPYFVAVPAGYDGSTRVQLQVLLPGGAGAAAPAAAGWAPTLLEAEAIVAIPDIVRARGDIEAIRGLIDALVEDYCVDSRRVGLIGSSSSGRFTARLGEASDDIVAAMAIGIGAFPAAEGADGAVPLLAWTGESDRSAVDDSVQSWAEVNGCDLEPREEGSGEVTTFTYDGCSAPIEYHVVSGMGHQVPSHRCVGESIYCYETPSLDLLESVAAFIDANPLTSR